MIRSMASNGFGTDPELARLYPGHIEALAARHDHALETCGASRVVVFSGAPKVAFLDDQAYPFRASAHFLGWVPLQTLPHSYVVYTPGERPRLIYFQPRDYWNPVPGAPEGYWTDAFDIRIVHDADSIAGHLPDDPHRCVLIGEIDDPADAFGIERINPTTALNVLHFARGVKTPYELACLRAASRRGVQGHLAAEAAFHDGRSEFEIHRAYCGAVRHTDNELPYANIVALNEHGAVLHYTDLDREPPADSRSFLIDAGAQVHGYASDITRTHARAGGRFADLVARVDEAQQAIVGKIRAGVDFANLHLEAHHMLGELLADTGLARGDPDTLLSTGVTSAFFPHGLGHLLGLQVHDVGGFMADENGTTVDPPSGHRYLRLTRELQQDMVLTVEPGLYAIDMLLGSLRGTAAERHVDWQAADWLRPFGGIRVEDNVRVTATGAENLTREAFATVA
jgi:Xaa-Pro dipeptidase